MKCMHSFVPPLFFEKTLKLNFNMNINGRIEHGGIEFKLDRNKAMGHILKKNINKAVEVDKTNITFNTIVATPTRTVVEGKILGIFRLAANQLKGERIRLNHMEVRLIADGTEIQRQGSSLSTDIKGMSFDFEYDALPSELKSLRLELVSFAADHDVNKQYELDREAKEQKLETLGQEIIIESIEEKNNSTYITITTELNTTLTRVYLLADEKQLELQNTMPGAYNKLENKNTNTRTLCFKGTGEKLMLDVHRMSYEKTYNIVIDIPIE